MASPRRQQAAGRVDRKARAVAPRLLCPGRREQGMRWEAPSRLKAWQPPAVSREKSSLEHIQIRRTSQLVGTGLILEQTLLSKDSCGSCLLLVDSQSRFLCFLVKTHYSTPVFGRRGKRPPRGVFWAMLHRQQLTPCQHKSCSPVHPKGCCVCPGQDRPVVPADVVAGRRKHVSAESVISLLNVLSGFQSKCSQPCMQRDSLAVFFTLDCRHW